MKSKPANYEVNGYRLYDAEKGYVLSSSNYHSKTLTGIKGLPLLKRQAWIAHLLISIVDERYLSRYNSPAIYCAATCYKVGLTMMRTVSANRSNVSWSMKSVYRRTKMWSKKGLFYFTMELWTQGNQILPLFYNPIKVIDDDIMPFIPKHRPTARQSGQRAFCNPWIQSTKGQCWFVWLVYWGFHF